MNFNHNPLPSVCEAYRRITGRDPHVIGKRKGPNIFVPCVSPANHKHGDANPSLRIKVDDDVWTCDPCRALSDCGGKSTALVVHAGLARNLSDASKWLCPPGAAPKNGRHERRKEKTSTSPCEHHVTDFDYHDANGTMLYQVQRFEGDVDPETGKPEKTFSMRRRGPNGGWIKNMNGVRRVPYRLPKLNAAIKDGRTILVGEGEKDVDRLISLGFDATTNANGTGWKWTAEFAEHFRGAHVIIIGDNDDAGRSGARQRYEILAGVTASLRIIERMPEVAEKGDVSDWLDAHDSDREGLERLIEAHAKAELAIEASVTYAEPIQIEEEVEWEDVHPWPAPLADDAFHGIVGDIVHAVEDETEADPAAMLFTLLAAAGNIMGAGVGTYHHDDWHPGRLFAAVVGDTSNGKKGTSLATVRPFLRAAAPMWLDTRILNGFGSGEGIVAELAPRKGDDDRTEAEEIDPRLFIVDPEFGRILAINNRDNSTQSMILRQAWDGAQLSKILSKERVVVRRHHISILAHITPGELCSKLSETDMTGGFANRFLYVVSRISKKIPRPGSVAPDVIGTYAKVLNERTQERDLVMRWSPAGEKLWDDLYFAEPDRGGVVGALTARWHAQKLRLAVLFAALDDAQEIKPAHLHAAQACWIYNVASVEYIFGAYHGLSVRDKLLQKLRDVFPDGLTGTQQSEVFDRNLRRGELPAARRELEVGGFVRTEQAESGKPGRPEFVSFAIPRRART